MKYILAWSGGKDSTALLLKLLENNYPLDYIFFSDSTLEFEEMYKYIDKIKKYIKKKYNKEVIILKPETSFEEWVFGKIKRKNAKRYGWVRGLPVKNIPCFWRREAKVKSFEKWVKKNIKEDYRVYLGYTSDEVHRKQKDDKFLYPLIDDFNMSEEDCKNYLVEKNMLNPLYNYFRRTGCAICPYQAEKNWITIYKYFPKEWNYAKEIEKKLLEISKKEPVINPYFLNKQKTLDELLSEHLAKK
jgi:3'-phosphoadenosine 5'-phosphosulfate sulfotransferase (PAPS reductase)/FAD synthetase